MYALISYLTVYISNFQCVDCQSFPYRYHTYLVEFTYRHNSQCVECQSLFAQCKKEGEHFVKVHIFWEGHKILPNLHHRFDSYYIGRTNLRWWFHKFFTLLKKPHFNKINCSRKLYSRVSIRQLLRSWHFRRQSKNLS